MTNPYLDRLRGQIQEKQHPSQPSKPSKPSYEGFEGDHRKHFLENRCLDEGSDAEVKNSKTAIPAYPVKLQNPSSPDVGCRVTIIEIPAEGLRYRRTFAHLQLRPPAYVPEDRWQHAVEDGRKFLARWASQAEALGWTSADLFGLHAPPDQPHPSYRRLSRYDCTGLVWLLQGREVVALTEATATIRNPVTNTTTIYLRHHKPALGPLGDCLDDFEPPFGGNAA